MLKIRQELMTELRQAEHIHHVRTMLAGAVRLELSTIPTYLTALFSIKPGQNQEARALVQSVVVEEMLHMTLAANTLIAIGGNPRIIEDGQALNYPGPLPMCVDTSLTVTLKALSRQQAQEVFMEIERPDTQAILPGETQAYVDNQPGFDSIGRFYQAILERLQHLENHGHDCFAQPRLDEQVDVSQWFPHEVEGCPDGKVHDMASARAVINTIVRQGEGVQVEDDWINPKEDAGGGYAHYFKFGEIYYGKRLVRDDCSPSGLSLHRRAGAAGRNRRVQSAAQCRALRLSGRQRRGGQRRPVLPVLSKPAGRAGPHLQRPATAAGRRHRHHVRAEASGAESDAAPRWHQHAGRGGRAAIHARAPGQLNRAPNHGPPGARAEAGRLSSIPPPSSPLPAQAVNLLRKPSLF